MAGLWLSASARRRASAWWRAVCLVVLMIVAGVLAGPVPARADSTVDSIICLNGASGTLSVSNPTPEWLDTPILTWSANLPTACATAGGGLVLLQNGSHYVEGSGGSGYRGPSGSISVPSQTSQWILRIETAQGSKDLASVSALDPADSLAAAHFRATHNSYSGPYDSGDRGAILDQLDSGVRLLELDIHDDDFAAYDDYRLGHDDPGLSVWLDGRNPRTTLLTPWLQQICAWTDAHPFETPVVVMLDTKDDFGGPPSAAAGNFAALNDRLRSVFGSKLILPEQLPAGPWPSVDAFRGRVIAVVSGDARAAYARDAGHLPAVAMNASGQVVEVHDDGDDTLWYWSGQWQPDGRIRWLRHGRYDSGRDGAVVLTDDGYVIEVHKSENEDVLYYHVGLVTPDFDIQWSPSHRYDDGVLPTVALTSQSTIREIHRSQNNSQNWQWVGTLNRGARTVTFSGNQKTSSLRFDKTSSNAGGARIVVTTGAFSGRPSDSLFYSTNGPWTPIAYWQVAFLDNFADDPAWMLSGMRFASAHQGDDLSFVQNAQSAGQLVRVYQFDPAYPTPSPVTFPATDHPFSPAYDTYARNLGF